MAIERLTSITADMPHLRFFQTYNEALIEHKKIRDSVIARGVGFMPFKQKHGITRFKSHEDANANYDDMVNRRVMTLRESRCQK